MTSLVELAFDGILKPSDLIGREKEIDAVDKETLFTPLGAAVFSGHKEAIKLLLDNGANPNGVPGSYPPLWIAAARTKGHIGSIVGMLLARKPEVDIASDLTNNSTPLLDLVKRYRSEDDVYVMEALVEAGADPNAKNKRGESAKSVATARKDKKILAVLSPKEWKRRHIKDLLMIGSLILFVFAWVNKRYGLMAASVAATIGAGIMGPIEKRFKIKGRLSKKIPEVCLATFTLIREMIS